MLVAVNIEFLRSAPVRIAHLPDVDVVMTNRLPLAEVAALCTASTVQVAGTDGPTEADGLIELVSG